MPISISTRRRSLIALALTATPWLAAPAAAQTWPAKPVTWVVPFPAGGGTDAFARPLTAVLSKQLGQQVVIDNKGGAGGNVGATVASRAAPDGYTWFMGAVHHAIAPAMYPKLDYKLQDDFIPVALLASVPQVIVVNAQKVPGATLAELLAQVKARPGRLNYGSAGNGTSHHLAGELFKLQTKTFITHIPYRGAGPALQGLIAGDVEMMFDGLGSSRPAHIKGGRIKALMPCPAVKRNTGFPRRIPDRGRSWACPTTQVTTWYGIWAPKGTPADVHRAY